MGTGGGWRLGDVPWPVFAVVATGVVWAVAGFPGLGTLRTEYTCENIIPDVMDLSKDYVVANRPTKIITLRSLYEIKKDSASVSCRGQAKWSDGTDGRVDYQARKEGEDWFISFQPMP